MLRTMVAAHRRGWEVARVHFRGAEPGAPGGITFHNAGRSEDVEAVLDQVLWSEPAGESPLAVVGFSLGGAILLKYLGERGSSAPLAAATAVSAPLDLAACLTELERPRNRIYHLYYVARQRRQIRAKVKAHRGDLAPLQKWMDTVRKLDEMYIAPDAGYPGVDAYYAGASCRPLLPAIAVPTLLLSARDDPFIPAGLYENLGVDEAPIESMLTTRGGHVGYIATGPRGLWFWAADAILDWLESKT
jgi:hypothetical protein